jgi:hypothetical protein
MKGAFNSQWKTSVQKKIRNIQKIGRFPAPKFDKSDRTEQVIPGIAGPHKPICKYRNQK